MKFLVRGRNVLLKEEISCHRKKLLVTGTNFMTQLKFLVIRRNTQITAILDVFCRVWLPLFRAKCLAESIGSHEVKYFIPPCSHLFYKPVMVLLSLSIQLLLVMHLLHSVILIFLHNCFITTNLLFPYFHLFDLFSWISWTLPNIILVNFWGNYMV